ncbi:MAG: DUF2062 domain-containing protein [Chloroflexota bacterium]
MKVNAIQFKFPKKFSAANLREQFLSQPGTPHQLGLAFAIGTFISILPTPGFNILLASFLLSKWRQLHRAAMFASLSIWNAFVVAPLYSLSFKLGRWFFDSPATQASNLSIFENPLLWVQGFMVGNFVTALGTAVICYFMVKTAVQLSQGRSATSSCASPLVESLQSETVKLRTLKQPQ